MKSLTAGHRVGAGAGLKHRCATAISQVAPTPKPCTRSTSSPAGSDQKQASQLAQLKQLPCRRANCTGKRQRTLHGLPPGQSIWWQTLHSACRYQVHLHGCVSAQICELN